MKTLLWTLNFMMCGSPSMMFILITTLILSDGIRSENNMMENMEAIECSDERENENNVNEQGDMEDYINYQFALKPNGILSITIVNYDVSKLGDPTFDLNYPPPEHIKS